MTTPLSDIIVRLAEEAFFIDAHFSSAKRARQRAIYFALRGEGFCHVSDSHPTPRPLITPANPL